MSPLPDAVLFDFSGTLFHIESAAEAVRGSLGDAFVHYAPALERWGAINGSATPAELPAHLVDVWERRDLSADAHRAAYSGLSMYAGLSPEQAAKVYDRGINAAAWHPYPDTVDVLTRLRAARRPVAMISNIGWDPRAVLQQYGVADLLDAVVLSDEMGVMKPDPTIFRYACDAIGAEPARTVMVGDSADHDGGATAIGCRFVLVPRAASRPPDTLLRAVGF